MGGNKEGEGEGWVGMRKVRGVSVIPADIKTSVIILNMLEVVWNIMGECDGLKYRYFNHPNKLDRLSDIRNNNQSNIPTHTSCNPICMD